MAEADNKDQHKILEIMFDHFMDQYKDKGKTISAIRYLAEKVKEPGCKLIHSGEVLFMINVEDRWHNGPANTN